MAYFIKLRERVYAFATKKDALIFACDQLRYAHERIWVYRDRACRDTVCTIEYMGLGIYNYYKGISFSWDGQTPLEVDPNTGMTFNPFAKRK